MMSSARDSGTSTSEKRSAISIAPSSRELMPASPVIAPTRSPGRMPASRPGADERRATLASPVRGGVAGFGPGPGVGALRRTASAPAVRERGAGWSRAMSGSGGPDGVARPPGSRAPTRRRPRPRAPASPRRPRCRRCRTPAPATRRPRARRRGRRPGSARGWRPSSRRAAWRGARRRSAPSRPRSSAW